MENDVAGLIYLPLPVFMSQEPVQRLNKQSKGANWLTSFPIKMMKTLRLRFYIVTTETKLCPLIVSTIGLQIKATNREYLYV